MKKLRRRNNENEGTLQSYRCSCGVCRCSDCGNCNGSTSPSVVQGIYNQNYTSMIRIINAGMGD